jgi:hypothetical protein
VRYAATSVANGSGASGSSASTVTVTASSSVEEQCGLLAQRADQPQVVQRRRPQAVDEPADLRDRTSLLRLHVGEQRLGGGGVGPHETAGDVDLQRQAGERRTEAVV